MATFAEKLIAVVGANMTPFARAIGKEVPAICKRAAREVKRLGSVGAKGFAVLGRAARGATGVVRGLASSITGVVSGLVRLGKRAATVGLLSLTAVTGAATHQFLQFDAKLREVGSIAGITGPRLETLGKQMQRLSIKYAKPTAEMLGTLYQAFSSGIGDPKLAVRLTELASTLAQAGVGAADETVKLLAKIRNAYGFSMKDMERVSDQLFTVVKEGMTTLPELAHTLSRVTGIAKQAKIPFVEIAAAMGMLTKVHGTDMAVIGLRQTLASIIGPSKEAADVAERIGLEFNAEALAAKGLIGFMESVKEATGGNIVTLKKLFPNMRAFSMVMDMAGERAGGLRRVLEKLTGAQGAAAQAAKQQQGLLHKWRQAAQTVKVALQDLGRVIAPYLVKAAGRAAGMLKRVAGWVTKHSKEITATLDAAWKVVVEQMGWLKTQGLSILEGIKGDHDTIWESVKQKVGATWDWIGQKIEGAKTLLQPVIDALKKAAAGDWAGAWADVKAMMRSAIDRMLELAIEYTPKFIDFGLSLLTGFMDALTGKNEKGQSIIGQVSELVGTLVGHLVVAVAEYSPQLIAIGADIAYEILKGVGWRLAKASWEMVKQIGGQLAEGRQNIAEWIGTANAPAGVTIPEPVAAGEGSGTLDPGLGGGKGSSFPGGLVSKGGRKGSISVTQNFNYRVDTREAEKLATDLKRLERHGRLSPAY